MSTFNFKLRVRPQTQKEPKALNALKQAVQWLLKRMQNHPDLKGYRLEITPGAEFALELTDEQESDYKRIVRGPGGGESLRDMKVLLVECSWHENADCRWTHCAFGGPFLLAEAMYHNYRALQLVHQAYLEPEIECNEDFPRY